MKIKSNWFPKGWDEARVKRVLDYYERQARSNKKSDIEIRLAEISLILVSGLRVHNLSIDEAEDELFNLDMYQWAKRRRLSHDVLKILERGMELEDVIEIVPRNLSKSYRAIEQLARSILTRLK